MCRNFYWRFYNDIVIVNIVIVFSLLIAKERSHPPLVTSNKQQIGRSHIKTSEHRDIMSLVCFRFERPPELGAFAKPRAL